MQFIKLTIIFINLLCSLPTLTTASANVTAVFAFGDSTFDSGNNNQLTTIFRSNHPPYGRDFPGQVPTGRFSNGKLTTDFLVSHLGLKELLPAFLDPLLTDHDLLNGVSFASAGSGLDELTPCEINVLSMKTQLDYFEEALKRIQAAVGQKEAGRIVQKALFIIAAGTNDMLYNFYGFPTRKVLYSLSAYHDLLLGNLEAIIRELYNMGARRFSVAGLPPIGCLPVQMTIGSIISRNHMLHRTCVNEQNMDSQEYNTKLQALTSMLQATLSGSKVTYTDIYTPLMDMIMNPSRYGFEETMEGCCGTGSIEMGFLCNIFAPTCAIYLHSPSISSGMLLIQQRQHIGSLQNSSSTLCFLASLIRQ